MAANSATIIAPTTAATTTTTTVKAWRFSRGGPPAQTLRLDEDLPMPSLPPPASLLSRTSPGESWVLVKVAYTGLNPGTQFQFNILPAFARAATCVPELDFCGTVMDVWAPSDTSEDEQPAKNFAADMPQPQRFAKGEQVVGFLPITYSYPTGDGALASYIRVPARYVVGIPSTGASTESAAASASSSSNNDDGTTLKQFAGLLCATCTAIMLVDEAQLKRGHSVLVVGASGGVGTAAVQLARSIVGTSTDDGDGNGGRVVAVCSGPNVELVKGLGADEVIDYTQHPDLPRELTRRFGSDSSQGPFDAILDCHGNQAVYVRSAAYLGAPSYVACSGEMASWSFGHFLAAFLRIQSNTYWPISRWLGGVGRRFRLVAMMDPGRELMERAVDLVRDGTVKVCVDSVWGYQDVLGAYEVLVAGRARGKILVKWD